MNSFILFLGIHTLKGHIQFVSHINDGKNTWWNMLTKLWGRILLGNVPLWKINVLLARNAHWTDDGGLWNIIDNTTGILCYVSQNGEGYSCVILVLFFSEPRALLTMFVELRVKNFRFSVRNTCYGDITCWNIHTK